MITNETTIAVLLATYNSERFIKEQLDSLYAQSNQDWTVYVRDDGSSDATVAILQEYKQQKGKMVILQDSKGNLGPKQNFMALLEEVESDYYMFMDSDDVWLPKKIENEYTEIGKLATDKPALVITNLRLVDGSLKELSPSFWDSIHFRPTQFDSFRYQAYMGYVTGCTMMFNHKAKEAAFPMADYAPMHDWWVALTTYKHGGKLAFITEPQMLYRKHGSNATGDFVGSQAGKSIKVRLKEMLSHYKLLSECGAVSGFFDYLQLKNDIKRKQKTV